MRLPRGWSTARIAWTAVTGVVAATLFWAAVSNEVYDLTSPPFLSFHVVLRKAYSIAAFALVGFSADNALGPSARASLRGALLVAAYSAAIEVGQALHGTREGIVWNAIDVLCGALGGSLGVVGARFIRSRRRA